MSIEKENLLNNLIKVKEYLVSLADVSLEVAKIKRKYEKTDHQFFEEIEYKESAFKDDTPMQRFCNKLFHILVTMLNSILFVLLGLLVLIVVVNGMNKQNNTMGLYTYATPLEPVYSLIGDVFIALIALLISKIKFPKIYIFVSIIDGLFSLYWLFKVLGILLSFFNYKSVGTIISVGLLTVIVVGALLGVLIGKIIRKLYEKYINYQNGLIEEHNKNVKCRNIEIQKHNLEIKKYNKTVDEQLKTCNSKYNSILEELKIFANDWYPSDYCNIRDVNEFINIIKNHEADTIKEMMAVYREKEQHKQHMNKLDNIESKYNDLIDMSIKQQEREEKFENDVKKLLFTNNVLQTENSINLQHIIQTQRVMIQNQQNLALALSKQK